MVTEVCPNCRGLIIMECIQEIHHNSHPQEHNKCVNLSTDDNCGCHKFHNSPVTIPKTTTRKYSSLYKSSHSGPLTAFKVFIWIFLIFPLSTMSNPLPLQEEEAGPSSGHHKSKRPHDRPAKWINPCRIPSALPSFQMDMDIEILAQSDSEIISNIITQVNKAELQARRFMEHYYKETFGSELRERDKFAGVHYDFLKEINEKVKKSLGEKLSRDDLDELKIADTLRAMYSGLQMFAVGIEQLVLDQSVYGGSFHKDFQDAEYELKYVLCELQIAMLEKGIEHEDVTRDIMSGDYRDIDCDTIRNIRDWVIFRDYVTTLEYIQQSFSHFLTAAVDNS